MFTIEERNPFGKWEAVTGKTFDTLPAARAWCIEMSDVLDIAYRVLQDGQVIGTVDLEAGFFALGSSDDDPPELPLIEDDDYPNPDFQ